MASQQQMYQNTQQQQQKKLQQQQTQVAKQQQQQQQQQPMNPQANQQLQQDRLLQVAIFHYYCFNPFMPTLSFEKYLNFCIYCKT